MAIKNAFVESPNDTLRSEVSEGGSDSIYLIVSPDEVARKATCSLISRATENTLMAFKDQLPKDVQDSLLGTDRLVSSEDFTRDTMHLLEADEKLYEVLQGYKTEPSVDEAAEEMPALSA
jgi:hypothetical protein